MSIDLDIFRKAGVDTEKDARAQKAVKAFRTLQPTLSAYARILTKNPRIVVEMAARDNGSTDGKRIFFRPPIALGDNVPHQRRLCDKRDEDKQLLCVACATREGVLTTIYHEIAHICFDSFEKTSDRDRAELVGMAVREVGGKYAEAIAKKIENTPNWHKESYIAMASLISEFLPIIVNALEDARVNRELFKARKGTKVMFDADIHRVFTEGVEQKDISGHIIVKPWNEYPLNLQAIVGLFCKASGYDYTGWFVDEVIAALNDVDLTVLVNKIDTVYSAADVYHLSFPVLARLRELGYCKLKEDPKVEGEADESDEEENEITDQDGDSEPDDSASSPDDASSEPEGSNDTEAESSDSGGEGGAEEGDADSDSGTDGSEEGDDFAEAGGSAGNDQSDGSDDNSDSESSVGDGSEAEEQTDERGESSGEEGSTTEAADNSVDDSGQSDNDPEASGSQPDSTGENQGRPDGEGDLGEDSEGTPEGDSEPDESEGSSGDATDSDGSDEAGSSDSNDSISDADSESVDSNDHLGSTSPADDVPADKKAGTEDVDLARSEDRETKSPSPDSDMEPVQSSPEDDEEEVIDTGADDGTGGTEIIEKEKNDRLPMGTPEECKYGLLKWGDHEEKPKTIEETEAENTVDRAIIQGIYFETPSRYIYGVRFHHYGDPVWIEGYNMSIGWDAPRQRALSMGFRGDFAPTEKVLGPALLRMRVAFADNQRGKEIRGMKSGKVDARVLGKRAHHGDDRLFKRKTLPGKKDYFVVIGVDISGSTIGTNIILEKRAVMAQAQLLARMGIPFAIYAHSGNLHVPSGGRSEGMDLDIYIIKEEHEVWDTKVKDRLENIGPDSANLDGHAMEFLRKKLDQSNATDKIIMYYSDGKMPAENHDEELEILQRELKLCKKKGYTVMGVGIRTDSPARHGLDTVQVDVDEDVAKVVKHLEKRLLVR